MREKLEEAFERAYTKSAQWMAWYGLGPDRELGHRFTRLLDAEAWLDAVWMLGEDVLRAEFGAGREELANELLAAIEKART